MIISLFSPGDMVKNTSKRTGQDEIGVLIKRCLTHTSYWDVLITDDVVTWFEPNMEKFQVKNDKRRSKRNN